MGSDPKDSLTRKQERHVAIVPIDLGDGAAFDSSIFPAEYYAEDNNLDKGVVLIRATLKEMEKIRDLGINLDKNGNFIFNTRLELEDLRVKQAKLENKPRTFNPFKVFRNYRAARLLHEGSKALYLKAKRTSERIHREADVQVVSRTQMRRVIGKSSPIPQGVKVGGISIVLPDGFNENVERTIGDARHTIANTEVDPFQDNSIVPQLGDDEQGFTLANTESLLSQDDEEDGGNRPTVTFSDPRLPPLTSPQTINNITIAVNSHIDGLTNNSHSRNSGGATITQEPAS